ncbi:MAG TPA: 2OG-Fe(II) oxygenase family protein [Stellaceae bacterium]|nr:2OG-Fe(II) oxygenase family protein [Stellaceae bacterium]
MTRLFETSRPVFRRLTQDNPTIRGYFPVGSEQAIGAPEPDRKAYFEFIPGEDLAEPLMSAVSDAYTRLLSTLRSQTDLIASGIAPDYSDQLKALLDRAPSPVLRITHYPSHGGLKVANHPHTDIDLVTFFPRATAPGLQLASHDGWHEIQIDEESIAVFGGEMLELMGGPAAEVHRVVCDGERLSVSFFVNANPEERLPDGKPAATVLEERIRLVRRSPKAGESLERATRASRRPQGSDVGGE